LVGLVFEELDESGGRKDRPLLLEAIGRVEWGASQRIVVAYLSRFGRSLVDGLQAIERITEGGGSFVSVQEGLDFSTNTGPSGAVCYRAIGATARSRQADARGGGHWMMDGQDLTTGAPSVKPLDG
jgi:DNA invertase Pin-like site-specific DNA recombinase